ncbi:MAG: lipocalin-like domain-containing protein [Janthinobacterium lividum]
MDGVSVRRRTLLMAALAAATPGAYALALRALQFPRDFGSHPDLHTEWWYITGHVQSEGRELGFQLTFFRSRIDETQHMKSAFAARQIVFAHAAVTDLRGGRLLHDQRIARAGFGVAEAEESDTRLRLHDWSLQRDTATGRYTARLPSDEFGLALEIAPTQPVLLQGNAGLSRKGPDASQASYYYSEPQLAVTGRIALQGQTLDVKAGTAWLDHEWSDALLHPDAVGWDWIGMNLDDGSALTAFHLRRADGSALWSGGSWRPEGGATRSFRADEVRFDAQRRWTSPRTQSSYPVQWAVRTPSGDFTVHALLDDQELDSLGSTGAVYWEGLSELRDAKGHRVGRGYLEMTGYATRLRF